MISSQEVYVEENLNSGGYKDEDVHTQVSWDGKEPGDPNLG